MDAGQELCNDFRGFQCPVCGNRRYYRIVVMRAPQRPYRTVFFGCVGCSVMFTDPYQFTLHGKEQTASHFGSASYQRAAER